MNQSLEVEKEMVNQVDSSGKGEEEQNIQVARPFVEYVNFAASNAILLSHVWRRPLRNNSLML